MQGKSIDGYKNWSDERLEAEINDEKNELSIRDFTVLLEERLRRNMIKEGGRII